MDGCQLLGAARWYEKDLGNIEGKLHSFKEFNHGAVSVRVVVLSLSHV